MKVICDFYKECDIPFCQHKHVHEISNHYNCSVIQECASTSKKVGCVRALSLLRKDKLKKINERNL